MADTFGKVNRFNIKVETEFSKAVKLVYGEESAGRGKAGKACAGVKAVFYGTANYACHHPYKVAATVAAVLLATTLVGLTIAYFTIPAYAAYVGVAGAKAAAFVGSAVTAVSTFLVSHPLIPTVAIIGLVAAVITAGVLAYMNNDKANKIDEVKQEIIGACEKDSDDKLRVEGGKFKLDGGKTSSALENICNVLQFTPAQGKGLNG